jgi:hypothetical protein
MNGGKTVVVEGYEGWWGVQRQQQFDDGHVTCSRFVTAETLVRAAASGCRSNAKVGPLHHMLRQVLEALHQQTKAL